MKDKKVCIYHGNCADGFTAAWVVNQAFDDVDFIAGKYQEDVNINRFADKHVIFVDFSYDEKTMRKICAVAKKVTIYDHHESAEKNLRPLFDEGIIDGVFDMERSGCRIVWDELMGGKEPPQMLLHIEDRDLWRFALPETKAVAMYVFAFEYTFENWYELMYMTPIKKAVQGGGILQRKVEKDIAELAGVLVEFGYLDGHLVPIANVPYMYASEMGNLLCESGQGQHKPFAVTYFIDKNGMYNVSLRSGEDGLNVAEIAKKFGGGGHNHAAGFKCKNKLWKIIHNFRR